MLIGSCTMRQICLLVDILGHVTFLVLLPMYNGLSIYILSYIIIYLCTYSHSHHTHSNGARVGKSKQKTAACSSDLGDSRFGWRESFFFMKTKQHMKSRSNGNHQRHKSTKNSPSRAPSLGRWLRGTKEKQTRTLRAFGLSGHRKTQV